jgi:hypothetical protein
VCPNCHRNTRDPVEGDKPCRLIFVHTGQYTVEDFNCDIHQKRRNRPRPLAGAERRLFKVLNPMPLCNTKNASLLFRVSFCKPFVSTLSIYRCANSVVARKVSRILSSFIKTRYAEKLAGESIAPADGRCENYYNFERHNRKSSTFGPGSSYSAPTATALPSCPCRLRV